MTVNITLDVKNTASTGSDGYTNAEGSEGGIYSYKYSGGDDDQGHVTVHKGTPTVISVTLHTTGYSVEGAGVTNDPNEDISIATTSTTATFTDNAEDLESNIEYSVTLINGSNSETFTADPKIDNIN